jgi:hypothetical protein
MTTKLAKFISFISNPLFVLMPVPFFLVYKMTHAMNYSIRWELYSFAFILFIVGFIIYGVKKEIFTDLDVSKREQRPLLFSIALVLALIYIIGIYIFNGPFILLITIAGILIGIFIASIVNLKIKASIHVATVSAATMSAGIVYGGKYWLLLIIVPVIGWARVKIKRHTLPETIVGATLGGILSICMYIVTKALLK